ncbi:hypothetical protein PoB_000224000 [Plakobranchus ocellatus]|uniref:Uncharacterized protein n=1 Tax=Plakobranchus ocellatus TaxID=259542 RepID=A0AAV3XYM2_9GAST|nr:hypothetical protein PoB_000224000 [Plakobranchus ocellatus]
MARIPKKGTPRPLSSCVLSGLCTWTRSHQAMSGIACDSLALSHYRLPGFPESFIISVPLSEPRIAPDLRYTTTLCGSNTRTALRHCVHSLHTQLDPSGLITQVGQV